VRSVRADWYVPLLFGATPPLLLTLYVVAGRHGDANLVEISLACLIGGLIWLFAVSRFVDFIHNVKIIDQAILTAGTKLSGQ
jgi:RsiW-degrading membrane proteinase PrsW (M82 family)